MKESTISSLVSPDECSDLLVSTLQLLFSSSIFFYSVLHHLTCLLIRRTLRSPLTRRAALDLGSVLKIESSWRVSLLMRRILPFERYNSPDPLGMAFSDVS